MGLVGHGAALSVGALGSVNGSLASFADPIPCIQEKCPTQYAECEKDPKCIPALQDCYKKCGSSQTCWEFCLPGKGSQAAIDTAKCAHAQGCAVAALTTPQECIEKYCKKEEQTCENDRRCIMTLQVCDDRCNTTMSCWKECLDRSKSVNATNYFNCIVDHDCMDAVEVEDMTHKRKHHSKKHCKKNNIQTEDDVMTALAVYAPEDCIKQYCSNEAQACGQNPQCLNALNYCGQTCSQDKNCWTDCLNKQGNSQAIAIWKCILDHNCLDQMTALAPITVNTPEDCMKQYCPNEYDACQKDSKCPAVVAKCDKKCGTSSSCWQLCLAQENNKNAINLVKCAASHDC